MAGSASSADPGSRERERAALERVLASPLFERSTNPAKVLSYICEAHFRGVAEALKEYTIAVEALGRSPDFNPIEHSVVRVEVSRLRKRLARYYDTDGRNDPIQITIPEPGYKPQFSSRTSTGSERPALAVGTPHVSAPSEPESKSRFGTWALWGGLIALLVIAAVTGAKLLLSRFAQPAPAGRSAGAPASSSAAGLNPGIVLIRLGAQTQQYIDRLGRTWGMDRYFTGGSTVSRPDSRVFGTVDPALYQSGREGHFRYDIPVPPGVYQLHLHFAETFWGYENSDSDGIALRIFDVNVNGRPLLPNFDIVSDAGAPNIADERVFTDVSPAADGFVHVQFSGTVAGALVSGIELVPGGPGRMLPVRIAAGAESYLDHNGNRWGPDRYFLGGRSQKHLPVAAGTNDPVLYGAERWGHFRYVIPAARGAYTVRLLFAERHWGRTNVGGGGIGSRIFDVYCNGRALLRNFDIITEAGGENRALEKIFRGVTPNSQGKILLSFVPGNTYATVNAVEIVAENR